MDVLHCTKNEVFHYSIKDIDLVTFTEEILNGKLHFACSVIEMQLNSVSSKSNKILAGKISRISLIWAKFAKLRPHEIE